ncbi:ATP-binding protein [Janthinobacterium sp. B9-8]|uniref:ATP-binding protein n=1 Tax=Janthinobacterium sp. B9-8 TaxID=1236179 RepID=UPI00061D050A|nr:ATP-binding protein [Janthinobacterium sp. B9-8]AMC34754.1 hypothetical protein VN23_09100 [Janthinobacterium sp. B9-8]
MTTVIERASKSLDLSVLPMFSGFRQWRGTCEKHGEQVISVPPSVKSWVCPVCVSQKAAKTLPVEWLEERAKALMTVSHLPEKYVGQKFVATSDEQRRARQAAKLFYDQVTQKKVWASLNLVGETGTGKTLLACEVMQRLIVGAGMSCRYATSMGILSEIKESYGTEGKTENGEIQRFADFDLLIIDEIDQIRGSDTDRLLLQEVVNRRYNAKKPVLTISNLSFESFGKAVGARIASRLSENGTVVLFDWADQRRIAA